ncbi:MAG TPA: TetR/AcrR family transcriptional regulator [Cellvibrio sp.]|nr:TetR/AcrR family transcriptional regulator [Cellvibrio sp.]
MTKPIRNRADGEVTRTRILETAGALFAAMGYAETSSKSIAAQAEVDVASINHHFGSRNGLYQKVLAEAHRRIVKLDDLLNIAQNPMPAPEKLRMFISILVKTAKDDSGWHTKVLAREMLAPSSNLQMLLTEELQPKLAVLLSILSEITGIPKGDPALLRCLISTAAPCLMLVVASNGLPGPAQQVLGMSHDVLTSHLYSFAIAGLQSIGDDYRSEFNTTDILQK